MSLSGRFALRTLLSALVVLTSSVSFAQTAQPTVPVAGPPVESTSLAGKIESHTYDLREAIAAFVHDSDLPPNQAREQAILNLFAPIGENEFPIRREEISPGQFKVWALPSFHAFLPCVIEWMTNDRKQISIEARIVTVSEHVLEKLHTDFKEQWELSSFVDDETDTTLSANPVSAQSTSRFTFATFNKQSNRSADFISATTSTVQTLPIRVARLTADQTKTLVDSLQADTSSNLLQTPKITVFPSQEATIKDTSQRPFVVSVEPIEGDSGTATRPIIRVLEDGLTIQLRASLRDDDRLQIDSDITFSEIGDVEEFTFQSSTVQIPKQHVQHVRLSKTIDDGETLLIDPHFFKERTTKRRFRSPVTTRQYTIVLLTPRIIRDFSSGTE